ncbi:MAG: hypothetical protein WDW38_006610 [Sanguina aurantia]
MSWMRRVTRGSATAIAVPARTSPPPTVWVLRWRQCNGKRVFLLLMVVASLVLPWLLPFWLGVSWLVLQQLSLVATFVTFPEYDHSIVLSFLQASIYLGISVLVSVTSAVASQQAEQRDPYRRARMRIARDLHDLIGHHLTALSLNLEVASHLTNEAAGDHVRKAQSTAKRLLADVREAVSELRQDDAIDLTQALRRSINAFCAATPTGWKKLAELNLIVEPVPPLRVGYVTAFGAARQNRHAGLGAGPLARIEASDGGLILVMPQPHVRALPIARGLLASYLEGEMRRDIARWLAFYVPQLGLAPTGLRIRPMKSLWGSLDTRDRINLGTGWHDIPGDIVEWAGITACIGVCTGGDRARVTGADDDRHPVQVLHYHRYICAEWSDITAMLQDFVAQLAATPHAAAAANIDRCALACAGYALDDAIINENLPWPVSKLRGSTANMHTPAQITGAALAGTDPSALESLNIFCGLLGSYVGDLVLLYRACGGVYLAGGILPQIQFFLQGSSFAERYFNKGVMRPYLQQVPVRLIEHGQLGVIGAAGWFLETRHGHGQDDRQ